MKKFEDLLEKNGEVGFVEQVNHSLVYVKGLPKARSQEIVEFESGGKGEVLSISSQPDRVEILCFKEIPEVGVRVARTDQTLSVSVGHELLGTVVDSLCNPLEDNGKWTQPRDSYPLEITPPGIASRRRVKNMLATGVTMVDLIVPLGKGQRELIIGDRKTGKTSFLLQTILTQAREGMICVYAGIGKKLADIKFAQDYFIRNKIFDQVVMIVSGSDDPAGMIFLTPYTAMSVAEYFRDQGKDVLVILDDLSSHAKFYREIALLGHRFPGRDSYPGDIFYTHSRLIERAGNFQTDKGEFSISCLAVVESLASDITGFIQTNIMSMTDGHIFFDNDLFVKGRRPAINPFLSVTRVGRQTQNKIGRDINRELTSLLSLYEKSESFSHFGSGLSEGMKLTLATGASVYRFFNQSAEKIVPINVQLLLMALLWSQIWQDKGEAAMHKGIGNFIANYESKKEVRDYCDGLVGKSDSFNTLLAKANTEKDKLLSFLEGGENDKQEKA